MEDTKEIRGDLPIFRNLTADDPVPETTEIESLCMNCGENVSSGCLCVFDFAL
jgi:hypothetical protein